MFVGREAVQIVDLLNSRHVALFHACQYQDFLSYLVIGGIPSRRLLETSGNKFTKFQTDAQDKQNQVWHRVFVNPEDHGWFFANGYPWTPNPYGPIQIQMLPDVLLIADDVAWTRRSAGADGFVLEHECIDDIELVDQMFMYPDRNAPDQCAAKLKITGDIGRLLRYDKAGRPEINCGIEPQLIPAMDWVLILVDDITLRGVRLLDRVRGALIDTGLPCRAVIRPYRADRRQVIQELAELIAAGVTDFGLASSSKKLSAPCKTYLDRIQFLGWQFSRYAQYLHEGTLCQFMG